MWLASGSSYIRTLETQERRRKTNYKQHVNVVVNVFFNPGTQGSLSTSMPTPWLRLGSCPRHSPDHVTWAPLPRAHGQGHQRPPSPQLWKENLTSGTSPFPLWSPLPCGATPPFLLISKGLPPPRHLTVPLWVPTVYLPHRELLFEVGWGGDQVSRLWSDRRFRLSPFLAYVLKQVLNSSQPHFSKVSLEKKIVGLKFFPIFTIYFARFLTARLGVEAEKIFSPLYFPTKYLAENSIKVIHGIHVFLWAVRWSITQLKEIRGTDSSFVFSLLIPTPPFIKGKLSLVEYIPRLFLCIVFSFKRNGLKKHSWHFCGALHFIVYFPILYWMVLDFLGSAVSFTEV